MKYIVTLTTPTGTSYLRSTIWTFQGRRERAQEFNSVEEAQTQLDVAKQFMPAKFYKAADIVEVQ
jgi:hypothetical protein